MENVVINITEEGAVQLNVTEVVEDVEITLSEGAAQSTDPEEDNVREDIEYSINGEAKIGNLVVPSPANIRNGVGAGSNGTEVVGDLVVPSADNLRDGVGAGSEGTEVIGNLELPVAGNIRNGVGAGSNGTEVVGDLVVPSANNLRDGVGAGSEGTEVIGNMVIPSAADIRLGVGAGANGTEVIGELVEIIPSGIAYRRPLTTKLVSINNYDEAWLLANGTFDYAPPVNPVSVARLDVDSVSPETTLVDNNAFGNKNRFTDSVGAQNYNGTGGSLVGYYIDHLTGIGYYNVFQDSASFADACSLAYASTALGLSGWHLPTINEMISLTKHTLGGNRLLLIGNGAAVSLVTSTTLQNNQYYHIYSTNFNGNMSIRGTVASGSNQYIICRNHYV